MTDVKTYLLDYGVALKVEFIVVVEGSVLFGRWFDFAGTCDIVYAALMEKLKERITLIVEACGFDFPAFVQEVDAEELPFSVSIMPGFDVRLVCASRLYGPLVCVR